MKKGKMLYVSVLALVAILFSAAYLSYAFFMRKFEFNGKLNIVAGTLNYRLESEQLNSNNQMTIPAEETVIFDIDVVSLNTIDSQYALYYTSSCNNISVKYINIDKLPSDEINKDARNRVTLKIQNTCNTASTINFGVLGGFKNNNINTSGKNIITIQGNITASDLIYSNPTYTTCDNAQCALDEISGMLN